MSTAQDPAASTVPPEVTHLSTLGTWSEGAIGGDIRLVMLDAGLEDPDYSILIDWTERDFDARTLTAVAEHIPVGCDGAPLGYATVEAVIQPDFDSPVTLTLGLPGGERIHFRIGAPTRVELVGGCP